MENWDNVGNVGNVGNVDNVDNVDNDVLSVEDICKLVSCDCSSQTICKKNGDRKLRDGVCCWCLNECNPSSQTCGRCARIAW